MVSVVDAPPDCLAARVWVGLGAVVIVLYPETTEERANVVSNTLRDAVMMCIEGTIRFKGRIYTNNKG